jgi:hypothetical protein
MALAVTSGLSRTCAVSGLVTHYINGHDHRYLRKEAPVLHVGATGTNNNMNGWEFLEKLTDCYLLKKEFRAWI